MDVHAMVEDVVRSNKKIRAVYLASDLYSILVTEQAAELIEEGHDPEGIRFFAEGVPILHDARLADGTVETAVLPDRW